MKFFRNRKEMYLRKQLENLNDIEPFSFDQSIFLAKVIKVIDGDSVNVIIKFNGKYASLKCRLYGIDTPETRSKDLHEKEVAEIVKNYVIDEILDKVIWIKCYAFDNFGRTLIKIYHDHPDTSIISLNSTLVDLGYAYAYDGRKKKEFSEWCKI